ncbi:MAG: 16S rRNA (uracil(1498)-N(3))-methyltransferase [Deltaproteobacteria bacterium]|nr:16S rRNA (uracil(1498)-N(3))-methyltransferase [Deltaproteobacteria bacterium]
MQIRRFFVEDIKETSASARIAGAEFTHLKKVLRLAAGDTAAVFNGRGLELTGVIESIGRDSAEVRITGRAEGVKESPVEIALLQGALKGDKPEFIVQKATELGIKEVCFYTTGRTVPELKGSGKEKRLGRAAIEAAKQCGRPVLPRVRVTDYKDAISGYTDFFKLILWEGAETGLKEALRDADAKKIAVLVGPEGGFSAEDVELARLSGFKVASLGARILRAETAAMAILSILQYELGDLN